MFRLCRNGLLVLADATTLCSMVHTEDAASRTPSLTTAAIAVVAIVGMVVWTNECGAAWFRAVTDEVKGPRDVT